MNNTAICKHCQKEFRFRPSQSKGVFCSNACRANFVVAAKFCTATRFSQPMRKYLLEERGLRCESHTCHTDGGYRDSDPRAFQIDHINGHRKDNRTKNLQVICAICHCKTETWGQGNASSEGLKRMRHENVAVHAGLEPALLA